MQQNNSVHPVHSSLLPLGNGDFAAEPKSHSGNDFLIEDLLGISVRDLWEPGRTEDEIRRGITEGLEGLLA